MNNTKKIEKLINDYILHYKKQLNEYEKVKNNKARYEDLLGILSCEYDEILNNKELIIILLNSIYGNLINLENIQKKLLEQNEIRNFKKRIEADYNAYLEKFEKDTEIIEKEHKLEISAKRIKNNLKYHKLIDEKSDDIKNVIEVLDILKNQGKINEQEYLLLTNEIIHYNELKLLENGNPEDIAIAKDSYREIPNIALTGYQELDDIEVSINIKSTLDCYINQILEEILNIDDDSIIKIIESYKDENLKVNEYNYIIVQIMNEYQEELIAIYECLFDISIYKNIESRNELIKSYYKILNKYIIMLNYYSEINRVDYIEEQADNLAYAQEHRLIYSRSEVNVKKAKILSDMANIRYEYYEEIYNLITKFKNGTLGNKKIKTIKVGNKSQGHIELKNTTDGVRIILKRVKSNIYNVLGVLIKKANNDMGGYDKITNRITPNVSTDELLQQQLELATITEQDIEDLVEKKGRKNGRR